MKAQVQKVKDKAQAIVDDIAVGRDANPSIVIYMIIMVFES